MQKQRSQQTNKPSAGITLRSGVRAGNATRDHFQQWGWQSR